MNGTRHGRNRGLVEHDIDALHRRLHGIVIPHIGAMKIDRSPHVVEIALVARQQIVDDDDAIGSVCQ